MKYCRKIIYREKEILSYCPRSSIDLNEKLILCLSIKDIVLNSFPSSSIEEFINICKQKQITRFKPDKSTNYDSTIIFINIQDLDFYWNFIINELSSFKQSKFYLI